MKKYQIIWIPFWGTEYEGSTYDTEREAKQAALITTAFLNSENALPITYRIRSVDTDLEDYGQLIASQHSREVFNSAIKGDDQ